MQRLAAHRDLCILLVDHHRKISPGADAVDHIFGNTAKAGVVDAALSLYRQRGAAEAVLTTPTTADGSPFPVVSRPLW
ncbi:MAG: hypothetical protein IPK16_13955 [Anaerolineales bacterium]|nr:hypothetical protein [Anaerolineales bacterium]